MLLPTRRRAYEPRRWLRWLTWTATLAPLPYSVSRLIWALGIPVGIDADLLHEFDSPGVGSFYILGLVLLAEGTALFTQVFVASRRRTVPGNVPLLGRRSVRPVLVVAPLLAPIVILAGFNFWSLGPITDGFAIPPGNGGLPAWSFWGQVATFWIWGTALTIATAIYWHETRGWKHSGTRSRGPSVAA